MSQDGAYRPLVPEDFSFHGFDDLMTPLAETLRDVGIRSDEPDVSVVEDAIFIPAEKNQALRREPGRFFVEGGIVTRDGHSIDLAQSHRRGGRWGARTLGGFDEPVVVRPRREITEDVVYLGWYFRQYGHFLSESLARTWILEEIDPSINVLFHSMPDAPPTGTTQRILDAFGIPPERMVLPDEPTLLRRVIIPEQLYELSCAIHVRMTQPFRRVAARIVNDGPSSEQPVYLSRRLLPGHLRQIVGEFELEEIFRENGFRIAYPELLSFEDQVRIFNQHTDIFTSTGSAIYTSLFALSRPRLHFLTSGIPRQDYFLTPAVADAPSTYCNCFGRAGRAAITTTPVLAETPKIVDYLRSSGLLKRRLRADLAGRGHAVQEAFDTVWLYATVRDHARAGDLAADIEAEALALARASWPLSWMLARYYARRNDSRVESLANQFVGLVSVESDISHLAKYQADVASAARRIVEQCGPETLDRLAPVLARQFLVDMPANRSRPGKGHDRPSRRARSNP